MGYWYALDILPPDDLPKPEFPRGPLMPRRSRRDRKKTAARRKAARRNRR